MSAVGSVREIYRDGPGEESKGRSHINQKWYPYQKKWYLSHFAHIPKEVHTMCSPSLVVYQSVL